MSKRVAAPSGWTRVPLGFYIPIPSGTGAHEWVIDLDLAIQYEVEKVVSITSTAATGSNATRLFRVLKGASTVVASATIPLADMSSLGEETVWTVTDDGQTNHYEPGDLLTVDTVSAGATSFTAGAFHLVILLRTRPMTLR